MKVRWQWAATLVALLVLGALLHFYALPLAAIGTAYKAKILCSSVFVARRDPASVESDVSVDDLALLRHIDARIDHQSREVVAELFGVARRRAVYKPGHGCALVHERDARRPVASSPPRETPLAVALDPRFGDATAWAFLEPVASRPRRTRAVVVVHKGRIVAERYASGFDETTPLIGWSMTKSVMNALVGILVKEGRLSLDRFTPIRGVTIEHLLHMTSGLEFDEDYADPLADVTFMLLGVDDMAAYATAKPFAAPPGTRWSYSSGSTNILARAIRPTVGDNQQLLAKLGMSGAVLETDASGTLVGSSFMYAAARDWARFGLLYLHDGVWTGERVLPEGWVAYTRTPVASAPERQYGAHFWLRIPEPLRCSAEEASMPEDAFHAIGHEGQFLTIIPSRELVIVRLGLTRYPCAWDHSRFVAMVLAAIDTPRTVPSGTR